MDAITMRSTSSLLKTLEKDFSDINFKKSAIFRWSPSSRTIYYADHTATASLLHEVGHALLNHSEYTRDVELLQIERQAWDKAIELSTKYDSEIEEDAVEDMLDSYRDWLHSRSLCPTCEATGLQTAKDAYTCLACLGSWKVNNARTCALRRHKIK